MSKDSSIVFKNMVKIFNFFGRMTLFLFEIIDVRIITLQII
jgi:hypothetical protein